MSTRRQDAKPLLAELGRERLQHEEHIRTHKSLGAAHIKAAQARLAEIDREEGRIYQWIAEEGI